MVETPLGRLFASSAVDSPIGTRVTVAVRQENISIEKGRTPERVGVWNGVVEARAYLGEALDHVVDVAGTKIRTRSSAAISIPPGSDVTLTIAEHGATMLAVD